MDQDFLAFKQTSYWPDQPNPEPLPYIYEECSGWLRNSLMQAKGVRLALFLGCGSGLHVRWFTELFPGVPCVCVDMWRGLPLHPPMTGCFERFAHVCRMDQIMPIQSDYAGAVQELREYGMTPDLVCVRHKFFGAGLNMVLKWTLANFPQALYCGDGGEYPEVRQMIPLVFKRPVCWDVNAWSVGNVSSAPRGSAG